MMYLHLESEARIRIYNLSAGSGSGLDNGGSQQVAEPRRWGSNSNGFISQLDMQAPLIGIAVNSDSSNPQSLGGTDYSASYFASVRD